VYHKRKQAAVYPTDAQKAIIKNKRYKIVQTIDDGAM